MRTLLTTSPASRFDSTYEGLKRRSNKRRYAGSRSFDSTYEGLKRQRWEADEGLSSGFDSTYEGLKREVTVTPDTTSKRFRQYL